MSTARYKINDALVGALLREAVFPDAQSVHRANRLKFYVLIIHDPKWEQVKKIQRLFQTRPKSRTAAISRTL